MKALLAMGMGGLSNLGQLPWRLGPPTPEALELQIFSSLLA